MRELDGCDIGNAYYSKYCPTLIFDNVFVPWERVFMCGETEFAQEMVVKFSSLHRQSHGGCKSGKIDCMIGAALTLMDYNGTAKAGHLKQKDNRYDSPCGDALRLLPGVFLRREETALRHILH